MGPALFAYALALIGCNGLGQPEREEARARVTTDRAATVRIVTSTDFEVISFNGGPDGQAQVELTASDTVMQQPPWEATFDIRARGRFYIQVTATDTGSITGMLEVFIDGERRANLTTDLQRHDLVNLFVQQR